MIIFNTRECTRLRLDRQRDNDDRISDIAVCNALLHEHVKIYLRFIDSRTSFVNWIENEVWCKLITPNAMISVFYSSSILQYLS